MSECAHPSSVSPEQCLKEYCGGFALVTGKGLIRHWLYLVSVSDRTGVRVGGILREGEVFWDKGDTVLSVPYHIEGVMVFDRGGLFEMFGDIITDKDGTLIMRYTPFDRFGRPLMEAPTYEHHFYLPGSDKVPKEVASFAQEYA